MKAEDQLSALSHLDELRGVGTAMVYPTLLSAVSDTVRPLERAQAIGIYRFWRDFGFVAGALIAGAGADATSAAAAIVIVAALTAVSGLVVAATSWTARPRLRPQPAVVRSRSGS